MAGLVRRMTLERLLVTVVDRPPRVGVSASVCADVVVVDIDVIVVNVVCVQRVANAKGAV